MQGEIKDKESSVLLIKHLCDKQRQKKNMNEALIKSLSEPDKKGKIPVPLETPLQKERSSIFRGLWYSIHSIWNRNK